jgi:2-oxo-4-hydroxy-4-carboxy-5-ureidoimidazoline decarboxylase
VRPSRLVVVAVVDGPGLPGVNGRLSTHVLDTHGGRPAAGVALRLYDRSGASVRPSRLVVVAVTSRRPAPRA